MAAALPAFQPASELGPSPSRESELEALCHRQAEQLELLQDMDIEPQQPMRQPQGAIIRPEEKQALIELLSTLGKRVEDLERLTAKQAREIEELRATPKDQSEQIGLLRDGIVRLQNEVASCKNLQENHSAVLGKLMDRTCALENKKKDSEINAERAKKIIEYLAENGTPGKFLDKRTRKLIEGRAVRFELLRSYLDIDKWQLNRALRTLLKMHPGEYCKKKLNKTTWILVERPKL